MRVYILSGMAVYLSLICCANRNVLNQHGMLVHLVALVFITLGWPVVIVRWWQAKGRV